MKYIDGFCAFSADEAECSYSSSKDELQSLMEHVASFEAPSAKLNEQSDNAHKTYLRASKEYLTIEFKKKFLKPELRPSCKFSTVIIDLKAPG
jgi:hypothetical protein